MLQISKALLSITIVALLVSGFGCRSDRSSVDAPVLPSDSSVALPGLHTSSEVSDFGAAAFSSPPPVAAPLTSESALPSQIWELTLDETISIALADTKILRSLNASVLRNPQQASGSLDPEIRRSDPNFGVDAALAEFDTNLNSSLIYSNNDDIFNNPVLTGGAAEVQQDLTIGRLDLTRIAPTGTRFNIRSLVEHDNTTNPSVLFPSAWTTLLEATVRQPLLQGRGIAFNQIAGPNGQPGLLNSNGVLISQINYDVSALQFERDFTSMINEIIEAYWQLDLAYRNFESVTESRDGSKKTWDIAKARRENGLPGGEADRESQAREQYYQFQAQVLTALNGDQRAGSSGVLQAEANLRRLINLPQSDGTIIRPADQPITARSLICWDDLAAQALVSRVEIIEQQRQVRRRCLECQAAQNFILPRLDAIATWRNNGFGDDLINGSSTPFAGALDNAIRGDHDEWEVGFAVDAPLGFRRANAGLRNARLRLCREQSLLKELEQQALHELGNAVRQFEQSHANMELAKLRVEAAKETVEARFAAWQADAIGFDELLNAQSRELSAQLDFADAVSSVELARNGLYFQTGSLLGEYGIAFSSPR